MQALQYHQGRNEGEGTFCGCTCEVAGGVLWWAVHLVHQRRCDRDLYLGIVDLVSSPPEGTKTTTEVMLCILFSVACQKSYMALEKCSLGIFFSAEMTPTF